STSLRQANSARGCSGRSTTYVYWSGTLLRHASRIDRARELDIDQWKVIDENRVDQTVRLGGTEEWTVVNTDQRFHNFHIHQTGFLVTEINGVAQNEDSLRDTFSVAPATDAQPGVLKVVIPFTDPVIVGRF